ncbi:unnamed protein product [Diatraea saccharalis]|uniref:Aminopeptidase n=1 Tax=Diatraea saccharalis TaxID=40085 RepID=A0A9N9REM7_9NEOP|nr:unnamed protein product [Diatraea saccharalis]
MIRALLFIFFASTTQGTFVVDEECLNYTIYPVQYELIISPYIYDDRAFYDCHITITVIANAPDIRMIELDARNMTISGESIKVYKGDRNIVNGPRPYVYDRSLGKLYIFLNEALIPYKGRHLQNYMIRMSFRKEVTYDSTGVFLVRYFDENHKLKYLMQTRLSPDKAKYFIPCFDNPQFESVFKITVYQMPPGSHVQYSNTSIVIAQELKGEQLTDNRIVIQYMPSPQVTLYQLGFHYSQFSKVHLSSKYTNDTLVLWAPTDEIKNCYFILRFGIAIIDIIHEYSSINRSLVIGPINVVGIPTYLNGYEIASWNLLSNNVIRVIYLPEFISVRQIEQMKFELAQQLSRIWLGNPGEEARTRWKQEWFKEGVATYLAYHFLAQYDYAEQHKKYQQSLYYYGIRMKQIAMSHDWHHSTPALINFNDELAVNIPHRYKELVTMKTASLLWMVENWLGSEKFHQALVKYINSRRGKFISLPDFMQSLDHDTVECFHQFFNGSTASKILNSWFRHSGYPVIDVYVMRDSSSNVIQLTQRRFSFTLENRQETDYLIPISYIVQNISNCYNCYRPRFTIGRQTYTFKENLNNGWIILNRHASGYYRVNYDETTWKLIAQTLKNDMSLIDELNRAQIVNDVFALYTSGDISQDLAQYVLDYLDQERSFLVWEAVISGYEMLRTDGAKCHMTKILYREWQSFLRMKVVPMYKILTNSIEQQRHIRYFRSKIIEFACTIKYEKCLNYANHLLKQWRNKNQRIDPDSRPACYYVTYDSSNGFSNTDVFNAFESEDKSYAEYLHRKESNFLVRIPIGEPRPQNISMSTTIKPEPLSTEKSALTDISKDKSHHIGSSMVILVLAVLSVNILR